MTLSDDELDRELRKLRAKKTAPGPDGVPAKALAFAMEILRDEAKSLLDDCLREGKFPSVWKDARVVLLPKAGRPVESPSAYRPICLLDEAGKLLERVIAAHLREHLSRDGPDLAECQFGFREGSSTIDAILRVKALSQEVVSRGGVVVGVSLDIKNAFNTLPWESIRGALEYHQVPAYIRDVVGDYLGNRNIHYIGRYGTVNRRKTNRGVPQGSVLGLELLVKNVF